MCACCIWKLRVLTSLLAMVLWVGRAGRREGGGWRRGGGGGVPLWTRLTDPRRRAARARISVLRLWSDCRGARCPTVSRCLWILIPNAIVGKSHRHVSPSDREDERRRAINGVRIGFICIFIFFLSLCFKWRASLDLEYRASVGKKAVIPLCPCCCGAAVCERVLSLLWNIQRAYMRKTMEIIWRGFIFWTKLDIYKNDVASFLSFFALPFCVLLCCSFVWSMATLWFHVLSNPSLFFFLYPFILYSYYFWSVSEAQKWDASPRTFVGRRIRAAARMNEW